MKEYSELVDELTQEQGMSISEANQYIYDNILVYNSIYNKDCYQSIEQIKEEYIIVTDPPYNVGYKYNEYKDNLPEEEYYRRLSNLIKGKQAVIIAYPEILHKLSIELGYAPKKVITWVYNSHLSKEHRDIAFYNILPDLSQVKQPYKNPNDKRIQGMINKGSKGTNLYDWWLIEQVKNVSNDKYNHPCQIPYKVMDNIIKILPNKLIVDPFAGTGTTLLTAKHNKRKYIGFEIDKEYCNIINDRLSNITPKGQRGLDI